MLKINENQRELAELLETHEALHPAEASRRSRGLRKQTVYVRLREMEERGTVASELAERPDGKGVKRPVRLYRLTDQGRRELEAIRAVEAALGTAEGSQEEDRRGREEGRSE